jgi:SAM-dependent methyltransferase
VIWNTASIRALEETSIRAFVKKHREYLTGRVLDFGAGKEGTCRTPQPYKDLVRGQYVPYEPGDFELGAVQYDAILCTQVMQYVPSPTQTIHLFQKILKSGGHLVLTGPTNWSEVEESDLFRFTRSGIRYLLETARFDILALESRASIDLNGFTLSLGWGVVAKA